ncbi:MAG: bifunctional demethylmenaquinone methyltransferase/2-methoxy-6-polyprenyl-1,4-benzoquinol methylase UbiE [Bacteroidales bacterium]
MTDRQRDNAQMFDQIAGTYDFLNHLLSLNIDRRWRRQAIRSLRDLQPRRILDVATGTADLALAAMRLEPDEIIGVDVSRKMLEIGRLKVEKRNLSDKIRLLEAPCENLPFEPATFDAAMVAFGVRNFDDPQKGLSELFRVLRPGGRLVVLEFSLPDNRFMLGLYRFYFHRLLPRIGKWFSKDFPAYRYLPDSVERFPKGMEFTGMLKQAGFAETSFRPLTGGICGLYAGTKK